MCWFRAKNNSPIIYFSLPKTASSYLFYALKASDNYRESVIKEWGYLAKLSKIGPTTFFDRKNKFFDNEDEKSCWRNRYNTLCQFLDFYKDKPYSQYAIDQLDLLHKLVFSDHSIQDYLNIFQTTQYFQVDFSTNNYLIRTEKLIEINKNNPIYICSLRPFLPQLVSFIHETFAYSGDKSINHVSLDIPFNEHEINQQHIDRFIPKLHQWLVLSIKKYNQEDDCDTFNEVYKFYYPTNAIRLQQKLLNSKAKNVLYINSSKVRDALPFIFDFLNDKGINVGKINIDSFTDKKVRKKSENVMMKIFYNKEIRKLVWQLHESAKSYYNNNYNFLNVPIEFFFPFSLNKTDDFLKKASEADNNIFNSVL